jgi:MerR family copper efflux transcriptional regulator
MKIGELARRTGVGIDTVRYYEREGLLQKAPRLASGYRSYGEGDMKRLRFVRRAKALGFTLPEVRELLALSAQDGDMSRLRAAASAKIADVDEKLSELGRIRAGLATLLDACPGHGRLDDCPILNALAGEEA